LLWNETQQKWVEQGGFDESGPIAINKQTLVIDNQSSKSKNWKIKLRMTQGFWRIDYAQLQVLENKIIPIEIKPNQLKIDQVHHEDKLSRLNNEHLYLIHLPGNQADLFFDLPDANGHLFLKSKGYYLEWLREEWMKEKNIPLAQMLIYNPKKYYKIMAKEFKKYETEMEEIFWNSRVESTVMQ